MESFIKSVLLDLKQKDISLEDVHFILPSIRAGVFLKQQLSTLIEQPIFSPHIYSIEAFVEDLSGLQNASNTELLFRLYQTYRDLTKKENIEPFESFLKWAQILLQDFNEIDRFLIPHTQIFDYLNAIKELNHWSLNATQTDLIKNHLSFWKHLKTYYLAFVENLLQDKKGYQGLIYREASENLEVYIESNDNKIHVFLGFNALNASESQIIQGLLKSDLAHIYWDIDRTFINDAVHDAGLFTRHYKSNWSYFKKQPFNWINSHYTEQKNITVVGVPKLVGQAKYISTLLEHISQTNKTLNGVAVILGEEDLLVPVLNSIPKTIEKLNVTMGLPLRSIPLASLFEQLFLVHKNNSTSYYYKDVLAILSHPFIYPLLNTSDGNASKYIVNHIQKNNRTYLTSEHLKLISQSKEELISLLFGSWNNNSKTALKKCSDLIFKIKANLDKNKISNRLGLEYLYRFNLLFNQLTELNNSYKYLNSIAVLQTIYNELLTSETLDFKGNPTEGLQVMGMLESRVLDFETIIISSVNEGILPSGKTNNSFIPFDVKVENNLPTYKEKDAIYTYHFYRLLQRAKNVYILYNTEVDALKGGEKSRFITQLEVEGIHNINQVVVSPEVPKIENQLLQISKNTDVIERIKDIASKGFSPSSLTNYIRNPIDFYYEKILGIKAHETVEESIASNTLGSVIHNTLEDFYKPLEGNLLTVQHLNALKTQIKPTLTKHFNTLYNYGDFTKGKNLIIFEIAQRYILNFITLEIKQLNDGHQIKIIAIEADETIDLNIDALNYPIKLTGKVDRIDLFNNTVRIIDYKSGKVEQSSVEIVNWEDLTTDYNRYSKSLQVLCYTYIMHKKKRINLPVEAGIISFKNLNQGFLKFGKKEATYSRTKNQLITDDTLNNFEKELKKLILEICNPTTNFIEKELN